MKYFINFLIIALFILFVNNSYSQYSRQDSLRGSLNAERDWWNVLRYDIAVQPDYESKTISGKTSIEFKVTRSANKMQIDLQEPLTIDSIFIGEKVNAGKISWQPVKEFSRDGNVYHLITPIIKAGTVQAVIIYYHGKPREAIRAPWDGGWVWAKDDMGRPWMTVACQGLGASVWYPCKDHQGDEPDNGASLMITVADSLVAVGNGRLIEKVKEGPSMTAWKWEVKNPINNYNIVPYIGKYVNWQEDYAGEKGKLDCSYWVLDYDLEKAKKQFGRDVKPMLQCFEKWFGPYPFYEDGFKLVETPHLGMEHQSAVAYGNKFMNGYLGMDLSGSGWGRSWDYIVVHEAGHEWFANNITTTDIADMWVHEGFTNYSEVLFVECQHGRKAADEYLQGLRRNIENDRPIIGDYGVNKEGSGDMYAKGANLVHILRNLIDDDKVFKEILRGLNKQFYHKTITSKDVEQYINQQAQKDFSKVYCQYLRTGNLPVLEYKIKGSSLSFRWTNCVKGFNMRLRTFAGDKVIWISPTEKWQTIKLPAGSGETSFSIDKNFYIETKKLRE